MKIHLHEIDVVHSTSKKILRFIAIFEGMKGVVAIASAFGLLSLVHHDIRHLASQMIGHFGVDPHQRYPELLMQLADFVATTPASSILLIAFLYAVLRICEATGIWLDKAWGEWLAALSGAIYIPLELLHLYKDLTLIAVMVFAFNIAVVVFMVKQLIARKKNTAIN